VTGAPGAAVYCRLVVAAMVQAAFGQGEQASHGQREWVGYWQADRLVMALALVWLAHIGLDRAGSR